MGIALDTLVLKLEAVSRRMDGKIRPYQSLSQMQSMSDDQLMRALDIVSGQERRLTERTASIFDVQADREEVKLALDDFRFFCPDEILNKMEGGDVIEIYDANFVQIYHNWIFHYYCSYDLLTLVTEPIWKLYSRPLEINDRIQSRAREVMNSADGLEMWNVPVHFLKEAMIHTPRVFEIDFRWICPVRDHKGKPVGFVSTLKCAPREFTIV